MEKRFGNVQIIKRLLLMIMYAGLNSLPLAAQTFVYSGRQYLQQGQSWAQIREMDLATGRKIQLTTSAQHHWKPWCSPDNKSILFTTGALDKTLYRFDRATKQEGVVIALEQDIYGIVAALGPSRVVLQEYGGIIEIIDVGTGTKIKRFSGTNAAVSLDQKLLAWQTRVDPFSKVQPHVLFSDVNSDEPTDIGEGRAPIFADSKELVFFRQRDAASLEIVRYNVDNRTEQVRVVKAAEYGEVEDSTLSPDGATFVMATGGGRYGTSVYWRLTPSGEWTDVDDNLHEWGGWTRDGRLIYATDGRDLRSLDAKRSVWVGDIKLFDARTGKVQTIVSGVSMNQNPRRCGTVN
jgi:hypothetical protein